MPLNRQSLCPATRHCLRAALSTTISVMNQLCVPIPAAINTHQVLQEVFALCRIPWIYDFIFRADPAADISMLLAPVQRSYALSARIFINATETSSRYAHSFDFNKDLMFYSVPAFSIGPITAGFCVEQPSQTSEPDEGDNLQCIRFIRDDRTGIFLHVSENETTGVTEVDCLIHRSSTRRNRVRMKFDLLSFRSVMRTTRGILHPVDLAPSLIYLNFSDERRTCPVCRDATATHCDCVLPLRHPQHPLDFRFESTNMGLYTGFYQGATVVRLCSAGHHVINATLQSGSVIQGEFNSGVTSRLHRLAVIDLLSRIKERPTSLVMPASPLNLHAMLATDAPEEAETIAKNMEDQMERVGATDSLFVLCTPNGTGAILNGENDIFDTGEMLMNTDDVRTSQSRQREDVGLGFLNPGGDNGDVTFSNESRTEQDKPCVPVTEVERYTSSVSGSREETPSSAHNDTPDKSSTLSRMEVDFNDNEEQIFGEDEAPMGAESQISVALNTEGKGRSRGGATMSSASVEMDKTEIRKQRNRAAAARSNLKRKLKNESIRRDLATLTQRAIRLRVKEMMLRDENTRLRNALIKAGISR